MTALLALQNADRVAETFLVLVVGKTEFVWFYRRRKFTSLINIHRSGSWLTQIQIIGSDRTQCSISTRHEKYLMIEKKRGHSIALFKSQPDGSTKHDVDGKQPREAGGSGEGLERLSVTAGSLSSSLKEEEKKGEKDRSVRQRSLLKDSGPSVEARRRQLPSSISDLWVKRRAQVGTPTVQILRDRTSGPKEDKRWGGSPNVDNPMPYWGGFSSQQMQFDSHPKMLVVLIF